MLTPRQVSDSEIIGIMFFVTWKNLYQTAWFEVIYLFYEKDICLIYKRG